MNINRKAMKQISGNTLKSIAAFTMLIDHFAAIVIKGYVNGVYAELTPEQLVLWEKIYDIMRNIGRTAFPLFAFLLVEGFYYTKDRKKYGMRLLLFALLSEIPYDLAINKAFWSMTRQNTMFTLLFGFLVLLFVEWLGKILSEYTNGKGRELLILTQLLTVAVGGLLAYVCRVDYTWKGILLIAVFYFFYGYRGAAAVSGFCVFSSSPWSAPAFLLIPFYNGKRSGKGRGFYLFYPMHLLLLWGTLQILLL